eukprot:4405591-Karenia_brevis.AAC.1
MHEHVLEYIEPRGLDASDLAICKTDHLIDGRSDRNARGSHCRERKICQAHHWALPSRVSGLEEFCRSMQKILLMDAH